MLLVQFLYMSKHSCPVGVDSNVSKLNAQGGSDAMLQFTMPNVGVDVRQEIVFCSHFRTIYHPWKQHVVGQHYT